MKPWARPSRSKWNGDSSTGSFSTSTAAFHMACSDWLDSSTSVMSSGADLAAPLPPECSYIALITS